MSRGWSSDYKTADDKVTQATYDVPLTMSLPAWTTKASQPQADQTKFDTWPPRSEPTKTATSRSTGPSTPS